ncbi:MAG: prepilin-type N-terminal cleavage/methylation domain-containing protein [Proteobacteria bacterium]|nr:prepilin-type N-terminal cleavage/methylation domain-containing protein [Pseudomonadota bacterium]
MKTENRQTLSDENGFTLIEALMAVVIFSIGLVAFFTMQTTVIKGNSTASGLTTASTWAADRVERLLATNYDDPLGDLFDGDGDGTAQDLNYDGVDDNGGNFGLDDTGIAADGTDTSPDGLYTIFWNVADWVTPVPSSNESTVKAVRVIVQRNDLGSQKNVVLNYYIQKTF